MTDLAPTPVVRGKRGPRSCAACRKLRKACEGSNDPPCTRCRASNTPCVFPKIESSYIDDAGLARLAGVESKVAQMEGALYMLSTKIDTLLEDSTSDSPRPAKRPRALTHLSDQLESNTTFSPPTLNPSPSHQDNLPLSNLHASFSAVATAATASSPVQNGSNQFHHFSGEGRRSSDLVEDGLVSESEARSLFSDWMTKMIRFCNMIDPNINTYEQVKARSPFLFDAILFTASRAKCGFGLPDSTLIAAKGAVTDHVQQSIIDPNHDLATLQALVIYNTWNERAPSFKGFSPSIHD